MTKQLDCIFEPFKYKWHVHFFYGQLDVETENLLCNLGRTCLMKFYLLKNILHHEIVVGDLPLFAWVTLEHLYGSY